MSDLLAEQLIRVGRERDDAIRKAHQSSSICLKNISTIESLRCALALIRDGSIPQGMSAALFAEKVLKDEISTSSD